MPTKITARDALLERLAIDRRRVVSEWRTLVLLRRATFDLPPARRRWSALPRTTDDVRPVLRQMLRRGDLVPIAGQTQARLREVTVPYANDGFVDETEILFELHPYCTKSHFSALVFHGVTQQTPKVLTVTVPLDGKGDFLPLGTDADDWEGIGLVRGRKAVRILGQSVIWSRADTRRLVGMREYRPRGYPIRVTTLERSLIDGLAQPELCGGIENVFQAWTMARDAIDLDATIALGDALDVGVGRQRIGYVLDRLGLRHAGMDRWRGSAQRGGSSKLVGSAPYASTFDERWSLSLNAPVDVLGGAAAW